jgi:DNA repair protein RecN (Recombination protein N)
MLQELEIRNFALIDKLKINFSPGLNILTGETGAGKSIIIGAVGLMLGERVSTDVIRTGADSAYVKGIFDISETSEVSGIIDEAGLKDDDDIQMLLLSRELSQNARSKCRINEQATTLTTLREVGDHLIDIHGQHEHQTLFRQEEHLNILDNFGGLKSLCRELAELHERLQILQTEYRRLSRERSEKLKQKDLLEFQFNELQDAKLKEGEEEELLQERQYLSNIEEIFKLSSSVVERLYDSQDPTFPSVLDVLKSINIDIVKLHQMDSRLKELLSRFENSIYELDDIAVQIRDYRDSTEFNPQRLSEIESRLDLIYRLKRKYNVISVAELLMYSNDVAQQLKDLILSSTKLDDIRREIQRAVSQAKELSLKLSQQRQKHAILMKSLVEKELRTLGMERTVFEVRVTQNEMENGIIEHNGKKFHLDSKGIDSVEFLISPNPGEELRPLKNIASGGEVSRIMLTIKTVLSKTEELDTMIFDEIDTGIGGRIAEVVGRKLKELSKSQQVICITHLPQIASLADSHCRVEKKITGNRTVVEVNKLNEQEKVREIARMLAGEKITDVTLAHAQEMVEQAKEA